VWPACRRSCFSSLKQSLKDLALIYVVGVQESPEEVRKHILSGLGSKDGFMDMMQLVSLILIPVLRQEQKDRTSQSTPPQNADDLFVYTVEMLLHDVTGGRQAKPLTPALIKQILQAYGEETLSENNELVQSMLEQAGAANGGVLLDAETFCRALTADVQEFSVKFKDKFDASYDDAMAGNDDHRHVQETHTVESNQSNSSLQMDSRMAIEEVTPKDEAVDEYVIPTRYTAPHVDNTADTFRSRPLVIFQWMFFFSSYPTYMMRILHNKVLTIECAEYIPGGTWGENIGAFFCTIGVSILKWIIILLIMSAVGLLYFGIGGIGNYTECTKPIYPLIGTAISALCVLVPFAFGCSTKNSNLQEILEVITFLFGSCASLLTLWHAIALLIPKTSKLWLSCKSAVVPQSARTESYLKKSAADKTNTMVSNALEVHRDKKQEFVVSTHFGQALLNFTEMAPKHVQVGGFCWTWKSIWNRSLFYHEGVLFSGRLLSANFIQLVISFFILIIGIGVILRAGKSFDAISREMKDIFGPIAPIVAFDVDQALADAITDVTYSQFIYFLATNVTDLECPNKTEEVPSCNDVAEISQCISNDSTAFCTLLHYANSEEVINATIQRQLLNASGLNVVAMSEAAFDNLILAVKGYFDFYFPTGKHMLIVPLAIGVGFAVLMAFFVTMVVLPSVSSTVMKLRSGVLPFVHSPRARLLRIAPDQTAVLRGVMTWGCLLASAGLGIVIFLLLFLYFWNVSSILCISDMECGIQLCSNIMFYNCTTRSLRPLPSPSLQLS